MDNGLIYKGAQVLILYSMQAEMLRNTNHFGPESKLRMARQVLFWPGIRQAVVDMCNSCSTSAQTIGDLVSKETHSVLRRWESETLK